MSSPLAPLVAGVVRLLCGAQARWAGPLPSAGSLVFYANHSSHFDAVVLWSALPGDLRRRTRPIAARDYWGGSGLRRYLATHVFRAILIARGTATGTPEERAAAARRAVEDTAAGLGPGDCAILFPEGTRGSGDGVAPFKSGVYHLCQMRPDLELVPVYLENLSRVLPKGEFVPVPLLASVHFGAPTRLAADEPKDAFLTRLRDRLLELARP
jgi:1-acyl-sn-glycerol-3-phosphate acyltransferase